MVPLSGVGGLALSLAALRVSLIFPAAVAIGRPIALLRTGWDLVEGNFLAAAFRLRLRGVFPVLVSPR